jgi:hypothetical protein
MVGTVSSSFSSFKRKIDNLSSEFKLLTENYKLLLFIYQEFKALVFLSKYGLDSNAELFEHYFSDSSVPGWESKTTALCVGLICLYDPEGTEKWVSNYKPCADSDYAHPEVIDEFMDIYGRYFEQFGFKPKSDNDGGDDDESSPKTPSPDLLSV